MFKKFYLQIVLAFFISYGHINGQLSNLLTYEQDGCCITITLNQQYASSNFGWWFSAVEIVNNQPNWQTWVGSNYSTFMQNQVSSFTICGNEGNAIGINSSNGGITIDLTDCEIICDGLNGHVGDPTGDCPGFEGVNITLRNENGEIICNTTTDEDGNYCCEIAEDEYPIQICAEADCKPDPTLHGTQTLDLVIIQKYILGYPDHNGVPWDPNFILWADANGDGKVTANDLSILRYRILGSNTNYNPCRVISTDCLAANTENPKNCYNGCTWIEGAQDNPVNFNLYTVGDVNNSSPNDCNKSDFTSNDEEFLRILKTKFLSKSISNGFTFFGFNEPIEVSMLMLSFKVDPNFSLSEYVTLNEKINYTLENGILNLFYVSNNPTDKIIVKDLFKTKEQLSIFDRDDNSIILKSDGEMITLEIETLNNRNINYALAFSKFDNTISVKSDKAINEMCVFQLFSIEGKLLYSESLPTINLGITQTQFNSSNLNTGLYFASVKSFNSSNFLLKDKIFITN